MAPVAAPAAQDGDLGAASLWGDVAADSLTTPLLEGERTSTSEPGEGESTTPSSSGQGGDGAPLLSESPESSGRPIEMVHTQQAKFRMSHFMRFFG